jgi:enoyl-CoA hydratase/carnithine racemase
VNSATVPDVSHEDRVRVEIRDHVATVSMTRVDKLNGLDFPMFDALLAAAKGLSGNRDVRVVILRGEGRAFCTGLDFAAVGKQPLRMATSFIRLPWNSTNRFQEVVWAWRRLPVPVIAVLHGFCYGGGIQLALGADFRIATPDCELSVMEARWGLIPDMTGSVTLSELVGLDIAKRLTMTGEIISGSEARELGIVTEVAEEPLERAQEFAAQLAARSPDAIAAAKRLLNESWHARPAKALKIERALQSKLLRGANHKIARAAGVAKQVPEFVDRTLRR